METPCTFAEEMKIVAKESSDGLHYNDGVTEEIRVPPLTYSNRHGQHGV